MPHPTLDDLRRHAVARTLPPPVDLPQAIERLGFVQADPIRAPARAQDLTLRHRVAGYRAGDLERRYPRLAIEEDYFVNYGYLPRRHLALMHPRTAARAWDAATRRRAADVLAFVRERGASHPRDVQAAFDHGRTFNWFGGTSNAVTQLLDGMHYRGLLRVVRRDAGVRVYEAIERVADPRTPAEKAHALLDLVLRKYAPLPTRSLGYLAYKLGGGAPQLARELKAALARLRARGPRASVDGVVWHWPDGDDPASARDAVDDRVRLLAPFDPIVWDRARFELLWGWAYRFEAYVPAPKRQLGYYALPVLWRDDVVGWANVAAVGGSLQVALGEARAGLRRSRAFGAAFDDELQRLADFLGIAG